MNIQPTIQISAPINSRDWILPFYFEHLRNLNYPKNLISFYFLLNNSNDKSQKILEEFKRKYGHEYKSFIIEKFDSKYMFEDLRTPKVRQNYTYKHLSNLRNKILSSVQSDYLFSVDSDILVQPDTLNKLLSHQKDICSALIYNGYISYPDTYWQYPNILNLNEQGGFTHVRNWYVKNAPTLKQSKLLKVDATGAICLMSKSVCEKTSYSYHFQGEDISWSLDCKNKGFELWCDISAYCHHIMSKDMLKNFLKGENNENNSLYAYN